MPKITVKNLMEIKDVTEETAQECLKVLCMSSEYLTEKYPDLFRQFYNQPRAPVCRMIVLDQLLGGYGVEYFDHKGTDYMYINMGDSYAGTIIYNHKKNNYTYNSWGDIVER